MITQKREVCKTKREAFKTKREASKMQREVLRVIGVTSASIVSGYIKKAHCAISTDLIAWYQDIATRYCNTLQHTATHCNTLQHTATQRNTTQYTHCSISRYSNEVLQHTATHCNTLQHTATHCNTPQHTATHSLLHIKIQRTSLLLHQPHPCVKTLNEDAHFYLCEDSHFYLCEDAHFYDVTMLISICAKILISIPVKMLISIRVKMLISMSIPFLAMSKGSSLCCCMSRASCIVAEWQLVGPCDWWVSIALQHTAATHCCNTLRW